MRTVTTEEVTASIEKVVADKGPDYIYPYEDREPGGLCRYLRHDGGPSCIVGHVLIDLGAVPQALRRDEGVSARGIDYKGLGLNLPTPAVEALGEAQIRQDDGQSWGTALTAYRQVLTGLTFSGHTGE